MPSLVRRAALLDQAVTQASALEFHTKQAETVIAQLRQEREITDTVPDRLGRLLAHRFKSVLRQPRGIEAGQHQKERPQRQ